MTQPHWIDSYGGTFRSMVFSSTALLVLLLGNVLNADAAPPSLQPTASPPNVSLEECMALPVDTDQQKSEKAFCLKFYALQNNDESLCRLSDELDRAHGNYNCSANQLVRRSVFDSCVGRLQTPHTECAQLVTLCPDVTYFGEPGIDQCLDTIAYHKNDVKWCRTKDCFYALAIRDDDPTTCNVLGEVKEGYYLARDRCFRDMAKKHNNPDICNSITENNEKQICLNAFVSESNNPEICNRLPSAPRELDFKRLSYPYSHFILPLPIIHYGVRFILPYPLSLFVNPSDGGHYSLTSYHTVSGAKLSKEACNLTTPFLSLDAFNITKRLFAYTILAALAAGMSFSLYLGIRKKPSLLVLAVPPLLWFLYAIFYVPGIFRDVPGFDSSIYNLYVVSVYIVLPYLLMRYFKYLQNKAKKFTAPS